ncbi:sodium/potassium-transporting ATPase subunit beta-2 [Onthophagus taurus]|uniref:sodium/potassium-transporting ATPase subunit beta-2 n=1 Tax=Onthophagus taurus TaxID=166361 RepID=UPI000C2005BB|nr:sodium/potassium-transporting ATPase subunit beta-2 [Onthophagus taurus]
MSDKKSTEQYYTRPPKLGKWEGFKVFLWNSETHQFLGRTGASWGKILLFYILFYAALIGFFAAMLTVFYQTLDSKKPKWQLDESLIGSNPGLGFRPMPPDSNVESTLIWYKVSDNKSVSHWTNELEEFLKVYQDQTHAVECNGNRKPEEGKVCKVEFNIDPCIPSKKYNFNSYQGGPCIFLKLNKIYNWEPDYYSSTDLPKNMPDDLKKHIETQANTENNQTVWISCEGENPSDNENIGSIQYKPGRGFGSQYFPFKNVEGYLSPLVAVYFEKPTRGVLINIECKAWAKNIHHDRVDKRGSVHFELMIDN